MTRPLAAALVAASAALLLAACNSNQSSTPPPPPSMPGGMPSSLPTPPSSSPPSRPSSSPPSSPSSSPSSPSSSPPSSGGSSQPPPSGSPGSPGTPSSYDPPADATPPGGIPGPQTSSPGTPGPQGQQPPGGDPGWEQGLPGSEGEDGWETSNQLPGSGPGGTAQIPPMPSERDRARAGGAEGEPTEGGDAGTTGGGTPPGDAELDGALEDFDGEILAEREVIRARANETAGTTTGGTASGGGRLPEGGSEPAVQGGAADVPRMPGGARSMPTSRTRTTPPGPAGSARVPNDIPDARDDDIIARQLREAAMQETDPVLKEKLWDEYRRYKGI